MYTIIFGVLAYFAGIATVFIAAWNSYRNEKPEKADRENPETAWTKEDIEKNFK